MAIQEINAPIPKASKQVGVGMYPKSISVIKVWLINPIEIKIIIACSRYFLLINKIIQGQNK